MVNLTTTRTFRYTRQATVSWIARASRVALERRAASATPENQFVLDTLLQRDDEHPNWWVHPMEEGVGPLSRRELAENQPRWLNAANKAGFFSGVKAWNWSRCGLGEVLPGHWFTVRYELDRDNNNQYLRTVFEVHEGVEPAEMVRPQREEGEHESSQFSGGGRGRGRGGGRTFEGGRGRGGGRTFEGGRGRGGTYHPGQRGNGVTIAQAQNTVDVSNTWASKLKAQSNPSQSS